MKIELLFSYSIGSLYRFYSVHLILSIQIFNVIIIVQVSLLWKNLKTFADS